MSTHNVFGDLSNRLFGDSLRCVLEDQQVRIAVTVRYATSEIVNEILYPYMSEEQETSGS